MSETLYGQCPKCGGANRDGHSCVWFDEVRGASIKQLLLGSVPKHAYDALAARLAEVERERDVLKRAAIEVLARWELPTWKDAEPTAIVMHKLRDAVADMSANIATEGNKHE